MYKFTLNETSYHGAGAINAIPDEIRAGGFKKVFVATDPDLIKFNVTSKVTDILDKEKIEYVIYSDIKANPTIENVQNGVKAFKEAAADCIVAVGGGSAMDTAKAIGIIITNPEFEDVRSLEGVAPTKNKCVPIIAVPTTAGTAAEVTINYVITDVEKKRKFVCVDVHDIPVVAVVDPDMMSSMPAVAAKDTVEIIETIRTARTTLKIFLIIFLLLFFFSPDIEIQSYSIKSSLTPNNKKVNIFFQIC